MKTLIKKPILFSCALLFVAHIQAQNQLTDNIYGVYYVPSLYTQLYQSEDGSPYLDLKFKPSKINDSNKTYLVRINAHKETAEVWVAEDKVIELSNERKNEITFTDGSETRYEAASYRNSKGTFGHSFFEVLEKNDKYGLYLKERIKFFKKEKAEGYKAEKPARFEKVKPHFYFRAGADDQKTLVFIPSNTKKFVQVFSKKNQKRIKEYIKREKLSLQSREDLVQILDYIYKQA
nr:hypothetical protein [Allomuricauda sp.]